MSNKEIKFSIKLNVDGKEQLGVVTSSVRDVKRAIDSASSSSAKLGWALMNVNQAFGALNSLKASLEGLTEESTSFANSMAVANTMAGKGGKELEALKDSVTSLAKEIPMTRDALANGLYQVISNGVPENNWIEYLRASAKASVGGVADLGETVKVTSTIIKNYGLSWDDAAAVQDKIQLTAKNGVTSFEQLAAALPRVTGNAATLGVSIDELMATFSTLTGVSGNTAEVSTQLAAVFTALVKPSSEATKMAKAMGIEFNAASIKAAGGLQNFLTELDKSVQSYASSNGMLSQEIYGKLFGSAESLRAVGALTGQLKDKFHQNAAAMANSAGTINEAYEGVASTGTSAAQLLKNQFSDVTDAAASVAKYIKPILGVTAQLGMSMGAFSALRSAVTMVGGAFGVTAAKVTAFRTAILSARMGVIGMVAALGMVTFNVITEQMKENSDAAKRQREEAEKLKAIEDGRASGQKAMADATNRATAAAKAQADKINKLREVVKNSNAPMAERLKAIKDLAGIIPGYNAKIDEQGRAYERNTNKVDDYIAKLKELYVVEAAEKQLKALYAKEIEQKGNVDIAKRNYLNNRRALENEHKENNNGSGNGFWQNFAKNIVNSRGFGGASGQSLSLAAGNRAQTPNEIATDKANKDWFNAKKALAGTQAQIAAFQDALKEELAKVKAQKSGGNGGKGSGDSGGSGNHSTSNSTDKPDAEVGSIDWFDEQIRECEKFIKSTNDVDAAYRSMITKLVLESERHDLALKIGLEKPEQQEIVDQMEALQEQLVDAQKKYDNAEDLEVKVKAKLDIDNLKNQIAALKVDRLAVTLEANPDDYKEQVQGLRREAYDKASQKASSINMDYNDGLINLKDAKAQIAKVNNELEKEIGKNFKRFKLNVDLEVTAKGIKKWTDESRKAWQGFSGGVDSVLRLNEVLKENGTVWEKLSAVVNTFFSLMDSVASVMEFVNALTKAGTASKQASTVATEADTAASVSNTQAKSGEALADAASSGAKLPFPANIAAIAAGVAAVVAVIATIGSLAFADGGIVPGTSYSGDRVSARVNSGEMILNRTQQANLWKLANTRITSPAYDNGYNTLSPSLNMAILQSAIKPQQIDVSVSGKISGRDIKLIMDKRETILNRS